MRPLSKRNLGVMEKLFNGTIKTLGDFANAGHEYDKRIHHSYANAMYGLKRRGYVKMTKTNNVSFFHLTPKGRLSILKFLHLENIRSKKWDGRWRIAIFDIPEGRKKTREYLRHKLKYLGFSALQESVYITPYPVTAELDHWLSERGMRKYFRYLTVTEIDNEESLKKDFGLK